MQRPLSVGAPESETWWNLCFLNRSSRAPAGFWIVVFFLLHVYGQRPTERCIEFYRHYDPFGDIFRRWTKLASSTSAGPTGSSSGLSGSFWVYLELEQKASGLLLGTRALIIITYWYWYTERFVSNLLISSSQAWSSTWATLALAPLWSLWDPSKYHLSVDELPTKLNTIVLLAECIRRVPTAPDSSLIGWFYGGRPN